MSEPANPWPTFSKDKPESEMRPTNGKGSNQYTTKPGNTPPASTPRSVANNIAASLSTETLLTRQEFTAQVLARHGGNCCVDDCCNPATDAHHILNRDLYIDGGYYLTNGAALCGDHHLEAEATALSVEQLRTWSRISHPTIPPHLDQGQTYDTWGNTIHADGSRSPGELFWQEGCRKILDSAGLLGYFDLRVKYPRTPHLPDSPGISNDDRIITDLSVLENCGRLVSSVKMDGESTTLMSDCCYARSPDSGRHLSRTLMQQEWASRAGDIPRGWRVVGENLYARRSVAYDNLPGFFMVYAVFDERGMVLSWDETEEWAELLDFPTVPVLYRGTDFASARAAWAQTHDEATSEGFVVRAADSFPTAEFGSHIAKWVRAGHVRTDADWRHRDDFAVNAIAAPSRHET